MSRTADRIIELEEQLGYHNRQYRLGLPIISDQEYDQLEEELRQLNPESEWFKKGVQDEQPKTRKEKLPYPMYSLDKCKSVDEVKEWLQKEFGDRWSQIKLVITPKLDGLSAEKDLVSHKAWTRGDGVVGQRCDLHLITPTQPKLKHNNVGPWIYVRGEIIFLNYKWNHFQKKNPEYKNPRNTATGLINGNYNPDKPYHELSYLCYDMLGVDWDKDEQLNWLQKCSEIGHSVPYWKGTFGELSEKMLEHLFFSFQALFPIDGLVIDVNEAEYRIRNEANGNPAYARAYKHPNFSEKAKTVIKSIERNINRHGVVTPVCILEPRQLAGAEVQRANGINMSYLYDWGLMPGTEITVVRSGEVIPKIVEVDGVTIPFREEFKTDKEYKEAYQKALNVRCDRMDVERQHYFMDEFSTCPFCQSTLAWDKTMTNMVCQNQDCEEVKIQKLSDFFKICGVEEFKELTFRQLYKEGWKTPEQVLNIQREQLLALEGWGQLSTMLFLDEMDKLKTIGIPFARFLHATGLFGGLGEKTLQIILDNTILENWISDKLTVEDLIKINGVAEITAQIFLSGSKRIWSDEMSPYTVMKFTYTQSPFPKAGILNGAVVVFSGFRDTVLAAELEDKGAVVEDNFTKKTNLLIVKDKSQTTSKMKKAEEQGTAIYTREELIDKLKTM